jgi:hypothetical protein
MTDKLTAAEKAWQNSPGRATDEARKAFYTSTTNAGQAWQPSTRSNGTPEPGGTPLLERYEQQWAQELMLATPSQLPGNTVEHYEAVRRDIDRRRAEILAQANSIASRNPKS